MIWDFRIIKRKFGLYDLYQIHRVFYTDHTKSKVFLIETHPANIVGMDAKPMLEDIEMMSTSFENKIIYVPDWNR